MQTKKLIFNNLFTVFIFLLRLPTALPPLADNCMVVVAKDHVFCDFVPNNILTGSFKVMLKDITNPNFWTAKLTVYYSKNYDPIDQIKLAQFYKISPPEDPSFVFIRYQTYDGKGPNGASAASRIFDFNGGTPEITTKIILKADGGLEMSFTDAVGTSHTYKFPAPQ